MTKFETGQRVEFDARDRVNVGTVVESAYAPFEDKQVVIVETDDETWAMHPDSLRPIDE